MNDKCLHCNAYDSCEVIKALIKWQKERELKIETVKATWVIDSMTCNQFTKDESIGEDLVVLQNNGIKYIPD